jgi:hypothetical protein
LDIEIAGVGPLSTASETIVSVTGAPAPLTMSLESEIGPSA